jgi:hypothetical protein
VTNLAADTRPTGTLGLRVIRTPQPLPRWPQHALSLAEIAHHGMAHRDLPEQVNRWRRANRANLARGLRTVLAARALRIPHFYGQLFLTVIRGDGTVEPLGLASLRSVTTAWVRFICDDFNAGGQEVSNMKFHGFGTGAGGEAVGDTALVTEVTNTVYVGDVRPTGSQASATVSTNATYTTVATFSPDSGSSPVAVTEHGVFSANSAGTLLDRSAFSAVNLVVSSDSLQATYVLTVNSGG